LVLGPGIARGDSFVFVSLLQQRQIVTFRRDPQTGGLTRSHAADTPAEPAFMAASADGRTLFVSLRSSGQLASYRVDPATGRLELIGVVDGGPDPAFLALDRSGKFLLTAYYVDNKVTVHAIEASGALSVSPVDSRPTAANAHGIAIDSRNGGESDRSISV
jgi:6-phosphogluconolactonase